MTPFLKTIIVQSLLVGVLSICNYVDNQSVPMWWSWSVPMWWSWSVPIGICMGASNQQNFDLVQVSNIFLCENGRVMLREYNETTNCDSPHYTQKPAISSNFQCDADEPCPYTLRRVYPLPKDVTSCDQKNVYMYDEFAFVTNKCTVDDDPDKYVQSSKVECDGDGFSIITYKDPACKVILINTTINQKNGCDLVDDPAQFWESLHDGDCTANNNQDNGESISIKTLLYILIGLVSILLIILISMAGIAVYCGFMKKRLNNQSLMLQ